MDIDKSPSIAVDAGGIVHIAFTDAGSHHLYSAENSAAGWSVGMVADSAYGRPKIAVDGSGNSHIAYLNGIYGSLSYATNASGSWTQSLLAGGSVGNPDIAVSATGTIHVFFEAHGTSTAVSGAGLWIAEKDPSSPEWILEQVYAGTVQDSGCSIRIDDSGGVHLAYRLGYKMSEGSIVYSEKGSAGWQPEIVATGTLGKIATALGPNKKMAISYYDYMDGVVKYASDPGSGWQSAELTRLITYYQPDFLVPIGFDGAGHLYAAFFDHTVGDLEVMRVINPRLLPW